MTPTPTARQTVAELLNGANFRADLAAAQARYAEAEAALNEYPEGEAPAEIQTAWEEAFDALEDLQLEHMARERARQA
ncbi:hypothetical protein ABEV34_28715 [Methylorubrum rhodesianum]|uniref:hypothetical protein n=1 Tax=Methylorubrum rhodesianum TaxID=29427 RepID=UPI003D2D272D